MQKCDHNSFLTTAQSSFVSINILVCIVVKTTYATFYSGNENFMNLVTGMSKERENTDILM